MSVLRFLKPKPKSPNKSFAFLCPSLCLCGSSSSPCLWESSHLWKFSVCLFSPICVCVCVRVYGTYACYGDSWRNKTSLPIYDTICHSSPKQLEAGSTEKSLSFHMAGLEYILLMCEDEGMLAVQSQKLHELDHAHWGRHQWRYCLF